MRKTKDDASKINEVKKQKKPLSFTLPVYDMEGKIINEVKILKKEIPHSINFKLISQYIRVYLFNQHQGTKSTKTRSEVAGSTKKIYRQKGTGRARHGDIKAPIFVGGGIAHGPKPKNKNLKINKKQKKVALKYSFFYQLNSSDIKLIDDGFLKVEPKTKTIDAFFKKNLKINLKEEKNILMVLPSNNSDNLIRASKNIPSLDIKKINELNPYVILKARKIIFLYSTFNQFYQSLIKNEN